MRMVIDFESRALGMATSMTVLMPETGRDRPVPVLYLLHGGADDHTAWTRFISVERYVYARGIAVVMPSAAMSFYCDEVFGFRYWTMISEEIPELLRQTFRVSSDRADTFVAGLSMGGYGAFKLALNQPERFAAAASMSGGLDFIDRLDGTTPLRVQTRRRIFGDRPIAGTGDDLMHLLRTIDPAVVPDLYLTCGTEDESIENNRAFVEIAGRRGIRLTSDLRTGEHEWGFWDRAVQDMLNWLPVR